MKLIPVAILAAMAVPCLSAPVLAQRKPPTQEQLIEQRAKKLAKPVFHAPVWETDYDAARARAKQEDKVIFAYFTRSYSA